MDKVGSVSLAIAELLHLEIHSDRTIYLGESNIDHMKERHPDDYGKYGEYLSCILESPDFVGKNPKDGSIEYVKEFISDNEYVKVAVRLTSSDRFYARSLYVLNHRRVQNYIKKGTLKSVDK